MNRYRSILVWLVAVGMGVGHGVFADGFRNPPEGGAALGRAGMRLTQGDDPSAITHNPANLMDVKVPSAMAGAAIGYSKKTFTNLMGASEESEDPWVVLPSLYAAWPVQKEALIAGVGVHVPFGQSATWDKNGVFRGVTADYAEMRSVNVNPTLAAQLGQNLYAGIGVNLLWSDIEMRQSFPWGPPPGGLQGPGSRIELSGDGLGFGANMGLTWEPVKGHRVAAVFRSPISVDYEGDCEIGNMPPPGAWPPVVTARSDFDTEIDFPTLVAVGYGLQATDTLRLEANVEWVEHSRNESMRLDIANNNALLMSAMGTTTIDQDWEDTWTFGAGGDWRFAPAWILRAGCSYIESPIPSRTLTPYLAEGDDLVLAIGLGYEGDGNRFDIAFTENLAQDRHIRDNANPFVNGDYEFEKHLLSVSYARAF